MVIVLLLTAGCAGNDDLEKDALRNIPNRDYNAFLSIRPAEIFRSPLLQSYKNVSHPEDQALAMETLKSRSGISLEEAEISVLFTNFHRKNPLDWGYYTRDPFTPTIIKALIEKDVETGNTRQAVAEGKTYWISHGFYGNVAFTITGDGLIVGTEAYVLDAIAMAGKTGVDITRNEEFSQVYELVGTDAHIKFLLWNLSSPSNFIGDWIRQLASRSGDEKFANAQLDLETIGAFAQFGSDLNITIRILYNKPDSARHTVAYFERELAKQRKNMTSQDDAGIADSIKFALSGSLIEIRASIPGDYQPFNTLVQDFVGAIRSHQLTILNPILILSIVNGSFFNNLKRASQTTTVVNMMKLGRCVEQYIMDHNIVGAPKTNDLEELYRIFSELEINEDNSIFKDGWDNSFIYTYEPVLGSKNYTITSYGADGKPGPEPANPGIVKRYIEDIIFGNGRWIQRPEGEDKR